MKQMLFLSCSTACFFSRSSRLRVDTAERVQDDTQDQFQEDNVDDEKDGDVVQPPDIEPQPVFGFVSVAWFEQNIGHAADGARTETRHVGETLDQRRAHVLAGRLHRAKEEGVVHEGVGEQRVEVKEQNGQETGHQQWSAVVRHGHYCTLQRLKHALGQ